LFLLFRLFRAGAAVRAAWTLLVGNAAALRGGDDD
jgi:hypothetical protein